MVKTDNLLASKRSGMVAMMHDEFIIEVHKEELDCVWEIKRIMESIYKPYNGLGLTFLDLHKNWEVSRFNNKEEFMQPSTDLELMKAQLSTIKTQLMLTDEEKDKLAKVLLSIDFGICENDMEVLQLFFKRMYPSITELKKQRKELQQEVEELKKLLTENSIPLPNEDSESTYQRKLL